MGPEMLVMEVARLLASSVTEAEYELDEYCLPPPEQCGSSGEEDGSSNMWYVGVIISILGSVLSNFGVNTQKYSMIQEVIHSRDRPYVKQPLWLLGLLGVVLGAVLDFAALGFAAQSLITPVGGFTMVANLFFANYWLGETITKLDIISTLAIIGGIVLIAAFADKSDQCYTLESLKCLYRRKTFIAYAMLVGGFIVLVFVTVVLLRRKLKRLQEDDKMTSIGAKRRAALLPLLCALLSGLIGAQSVLFAKSTIEILKSTARGNAEFTQLATYLIILAMFLAIFGQIHWLAVALSEFDAVVIVPVFQSVFVSFTIIAGASYFGEFRNFNTLQKIFFPLGLMMLIAGVLGLAKHKSRTPEELLLLEAESQGITDVATSPADDVEGGAAHGASSHNLPHTSSFASVGSGVIQDETRRESFRRYQEFSNLSPYGAVTGRWIPLEFLLSEVESNIERVGSFFQRGSEHFPGFGTGGDAGSESRRRSSAPGNPVGSLAASPLPASDSNRRARGFFSRAWPFGQGEETPAPEEDASPAGRARKSASFNDVRTQLNYSKRGLDTLDSSSDEDNDDEDNDDVVPERGPGSGSSRGDGKTRRQGR